MTTDATAPALNPDAVTIILGLIDFEDYAAKLRNLTERDFIRLSVVLDELVQRELVEVVAGGGYDPTNEAVEAAYAASLKA